MFPRKEPHEQNQGPVVKALRGTFTDRPIVSVPNMPLVPTGDPAVLRAVSDEIAARRPDVVRGAPVGQLDRFVARVTADEPTINDVASLLHLVGTVDTVDPSRLQGLCVLASRALGKFDAHTRHAPPAAIRDLVADSLMTCAAHPENGCVESVAPWDGPVTCGSVECADTYARMVGE